MEDGLFEQQFRNVEQPKFSQTLAMDAIPHVQNEASTDSTLSMSTEAVNFSEHANIIADCAWNPQCESKPNAMAYDAPPASIAAVDLAPSGQHGPHKKLLKLNLDLIEDLELLEAGSLNLGSPSLLKEDFHPTVGKLDLPVFRMLSHSTQFLEILQSEVGTDPLESSHGNVCTTEASQKAPSIHEYVKTPFTELTSGSMDDGEIAAATNDSGYFSLMDQSSEGSRSVPSMKCDISTSLNILATYCHLVQVYRAVFTKLYRLFLIIPPADAASILLLPSLQFGQFHMDGNLTVQVQVLIELGSSMLEKIERTLGLSYGSPREIGGEASPVSYILGDSSLASIRDHIVTQEQAAGVIPLKETMNCLRQLLKDPVNV